MNESTNEPTSLQPFYKQKQWIVTVAVVIVALIGVFVGLLLKQSADDASRVTAKNSAADYLKAAKPEFEATDKKVSSTMNAGATAEVAQQAVETLQKANQTRPRLADVKGAGAEITEYKAAQALDEAIGSYYSNSAKYFNDDVLAFARYSAGINALASARDQAAASINSSGNDRGAIVNAIRTKAVPGLQSALDAFKKIKAPVGADKLTELVVSTHQDFIKAYESVAMVLETGSGGQQYDFAPKITQINNDLKTLGDTVTKKADALKAQAASINKQL